MAAARRHDRGRLSGWAGPLHRRRSSRCRGWRPSRCPARGRRRRAPAPGSGRRLRGRVASPTGSRSSSTAPSRPQLCAPALDAGAADIAPAPQPAELRRGRGCTAAPAAPSSPAWTDAVVGVVPARAASGRAPRSAQRLAPDAAKRPSRFSVRGDANSASLTRSRRASIAPQMRVRSDSRSLAPQSDCPHSAPIPLHPRRFAAIPRRSSGSPRPQRDGVDSGPVAPAWVFHGPDRGLLDVIRKRNDPRLKRWVDWRGTRVPLTPRGRVGPCVAVGRSSCSVAPVTVLADRLGDRTRRAPADRARRTRRPQVARAAAGAVAPPARL